MIFVTLHVGMKDRILRFSALLLVLWYCFSVIGFGVHTCKASGRSFIATFVSGLSCEEIHPEHDCTSDHGNVDAHDCCCHHHAAKKYESTCCGAGAHLSEYSAENCCCSNDYHVLTITGNTVEEDDKNINSVEQIEYPIFLSMLDVPVIKAEDFYRHKYKPDFRSLYVRDVLSLNSVLLI